MVLAHIRAGSTLVVTPRLYPDLLLHAKGMAEVISVEALMSLDPDDYQRSLKNLGELNNSSAHTTHLFLNIV